MVNKELVRRLWARASAAQSVSLVQHGSNGMSGLCIRTGGTLVGTCRSTSCMDRIHLSKCIDDVGRVGLRDPCHWKWNAWIDSPHGFHVVVQMRVQPFISGATCVVDRKRRFRLSSTLSGTVHILSPQGISLLHVRIVTSFHAVLHRTSFHWRCAKRARQPRGAHTGAC